MKEKVIRIGCITLLCAQWVCGQTKAPEPVEVRGRRAWVVATTMPKDVANPLPILTDEKLEMVRMHLRMVNQAVPVDDTGVVRAVKAITMPDGTLGYEDLARCVVPEGVREALIVLVPNDKEEGLKFSSKVIDLAKFRKGGCLYVNLVKTKIGITIGEQKAVLAPGGMEFINPLEDQKSGVFPVRFFYEIPKDPEAEWKLMTSSKMAIYDSRREICIFFYNKEIGNVDFRGVPFITPPQAPSQRSQD